MTEMTETGVFPQSFYNLSLKDTLGEKQHLGHLGHRPLMKIRPPMMPHPPIVSPAGGLGCWCKETRPIYPETGKKNTVSFRKHSPMNPQPPNNKTA